jgi:hypothetical protein
VAAATAPAVFRKFLRESDAGVMIFDGEFIRLGIRLIDAGLRGTRQDLEVTGRRG